LTRATHEINNEKNKNNSSRFRKYNGAYHTKEETSMNASWLRQVRRAAVVLLAAFGIAAVGAGSATAQSATSRLDEIIKRDKLIVATFSTAPPFCYTDEGGKLVGFDIDIAHLSRNRCSATRTRSSSSPSRAKGAGRP
jgi:hypothetical protein